MRRRKYLCGMSSVATLATAGCGSLLGGQDGVDELHTTETGVDRSRADIGVETTVVAPADLSTREITVRFQLIEGDSVVRETERRLEISGGQSMPVVVRMENVSDAERDRIDGARAMVVDE